MSACGDFAEHVWKPGSCKNCFHPLSAHQRSRGGLGGGAAPAVCLRVSVGGLDEEDGVAAPSPYSKPTIAVKPTMMMNANDTCDVMTDVNMNIEQENPKSPVQHLGLKKLLDLSSLYIDGNGTKMGYTTCFSPPPPGPLGPLSPTTGPLGRPSSPAMAPPVVVGNVFVAQETINNAAARTIKSTYNGSNHQELNQNSAEKPLSPGALGNSVHSNGVISSTGTTSSPDAVITSSVPSSSTTFTFDTVVTHSPQQPPRVPTPTSSLSDSSCSYRSSTDSLGGGGGRRAGSESPRSPMASPRSPPHHHHHHHAPNGQPEIEPIYAESTKRKRRSQVNGEQTQVQASSERCEPEGQTRATITVMAARTEENNRTFYLSSPDSAVSTQCHFSPASLKDGPPVFHWPSPAHGGGGTPPSAAEPAGLSSATLLLQAKPQSSPPIPPKRNMRSPKLGTSSLSSTSSTTSSTSSWCSSPVPLPDLPVLVLLSPREGVHHYHHLKPHTENHHAGTAAPPVERRHKPGHHGSGSGWNCRIEEEVEEEGGDEKKETTTSSRVTPVNGATVWREASRDWRAHGGSRAPPPPPPSLVTEPGTAPLPLPLLLHLPLPLPLPPPPSVAAAAAAAAAPDNGACQGQSGGTEQEPVDEDKKEEGEEEGKHNRSMLAMKAALPLASSASASAELLLQAAGNHDEPCCPPPPPPPKKHHHNRVSGKMSGSNMELDRCYQQGSVESLTQSVRGLGSASLPTASTDSLNADTGSRDASRMASCSSPFPRSPITSAPGSPRPTDPLNSNGLSSSQPPPLPEKKMVNRTVSAPDAANGKPFVRAYPRLPFTGSESNVCRPADSSRASLPSSPVDPRPLFSSSESLERYHAPLTRPSSRSRTLDEPPKTTRGGGGRLGVHCRGSVTCSSSPQLSAPFSASEPLPPRSSAPHSGSSLQLQTLLSNIDSREGVYSKLGGLYAESLRRLALKCEDHFTRSQRSPLRFDESNWSLFKLTCNRPSCNAGDAVYYAAACASDASSSYAVKICKSPSMEAKQGHLYGLSVQQSMPPHFNLQQDCGHFNACVPQSMLPCDEASSPATTTTASSSSSSQPSLAAQQQQQQQAADRERVVVIAREVPQQSAADFVREWEAFHRAQPEVYERRVCFLLLQLCGGLEHLKENGVTHRDLCLENLLLVPHHRRLSAGAQHGHAPPAAPLPSQPAAANNDASNGSGSGDSQRHLPRLLISNFAKAKRRSAEDAASASADPRVKRDHARLAPEIVSAAQYRKFDEFQTGILIYELLHQPNPFEVSPALKEQDYSCEDLPPIPALSIYSAGLRRLAQLLLQPDPIKRIHIQEAKRVLQSLLWGPRKDLMEQHGSGGGGPAAEGSRHEGLLNWLDVKRALLMMKFAERSLEPERNAELEDWLCCQYFSSAHPLSLCHTAELLYALK